MHERDLAARMTAAHHAHHDVSVSTMHVHLDHDHCLEAAILRGPTAEVKRFSQALIAERGVRHGQVNLVPVEVGRPHEHRREITAHEHTHEHDDHAHHAHHPESPPHVHIHPKT